MNSADMVATLGNIAANASVSIQDATGAFERLGDALGRTMRTLTVDGHEGTKADWAVVEVAWANRHDMTKSERRTVDRLLKVPGRVVARGDIHLDPEEIIGLAKIAYRYRARLDAKTVMLIALKGGVPAEHPGERA